MAEKSIFRRQTFENNKAKSVLIFACPFGTKIGLYKMLIKGLVKDGFIVVAYDFDNQVLLSGEPSYLINLINEANKDINRVIRDYEDCGITDFGFYGTSLGAFVLFNAVAVGPDLRWGIFNAGGNIARGVWELKRTRRAFEKQGYTLDDLDKAWTKIIYPDFKNRDKRSRFIVMGSKNDHVAPYSRLEDFAGYITNKSGAEVELIKVIGYGHNHSAFIGLMKCRRLIRQLDLKS